MTIDASTIISVVSVSGAIATAVFAFRRDTNSVTQTVINAQKEEIALLEKRVSTCEQLHRENLAHQGKMQGAMETMERVLQNRSPDLEQTLKTLVNAASENSSMTKKILDTLTQMASMHTTIKA